MIKGIFNPKEYSNLHRVNKVLCTNEVVLGLDCPSVTLTTFEGELQCDPHEERSFEIGVSLRALPPAYLLDPSLQTCACFADDISD